MDQPYDPAHNYCGPEGRFSFPNKFYGVNVNYECYLHDLAYARGGNAMHREIADKVFYESMMKKIRARHPWYSPQRVLAWRRARKMYLFTRAGGHMFFGKPSKHRRGHA